jgi:TRAP-type mannitol/chloroaromatic compound transport system permease large subunit
MLGAEIAALLLFSVIIVLLMAGYPVAFTLGGVSLLFAVAAQAFGFFDPAISKHCRAASSAR